MYFRSFATRGSVTELPACLDLAIAACRAAGFDLVIVETPGIGQGDAAVVPHVDFALYVMTPEFGAASQLEKIDMLDFAGAVAINKFERRGGEDALRDVRRQLARGGEHPGVRLEELPVFGTVASRFNDDGVTALYQYLRQDAWAQSAGPGVLRPVGGPHVDPGAAIVPPGPGPLSGGHRPDRARLPPGHRTRRPAPRRRRQQRARWPPCCTTTAAHRCRRGGRAGRGPASPGAQTRPAGSSSTPGRPRVAWYRDEERARVSLSGTPVPRVALPRFTDDGDLLRWLRSENLPGEFPYTAGVFSFKREGEDPARMFAGEGDAFRTNRRFHLLSEGQPATRLSTAFDSVTLYGFDPDLRPDIYGKVGNSGVSIATLDDMKELFDGFNLCDPTTSVSMTINGPAPTILAMFLNAAIDDQLARRQARRRPAAHARRGARRSGPAPCARCGAPCRPTSSRRTRARTPASSRPSSRCGSWPTCRSGSSPTRVRNFYSVSISGYHIAGGGANPISQLAFTLANGFTYVEAYLARGMKIDDFAPNFSFFFSNGMDPEYTVIGRVARRIWAVAMRDRYGANPRSQKLKYHIQTSGRSLHAQEMAFNDIRTTLQALCAIYDNANSLHTNAYDEAVTTPTAESVRRALAIQMIINQEWGLAAQREPAPGQLRGGGADRAGRGGRPGGDGAPERAGGRSGRHGDRLPAGPDPGRVDALRVEEARRQPARSWG